MEKELNIAAILKDKPNAILYDLLHNKKVKFDKVCEVGIGTVMGSETVIWCDNYLRNPKELICAFDYSERGTARGCLDGLQILKPSKEMQDWSKFAWKKGDVLELGENKTNLCFFDRWNNDDYTSFTGRYCPFGNYEFSITYGIDTKLQTKHYHKVSSEDAEAYIKKIEHYYGGKLNLETLQIDKQEFNEGDIVFVKVEAKDSNSIGIVMNVGNGLNYHYWANYFYKTGVLRVAESCDDYVVGHSRYEEVRLANSSEKQKLFSALEKEGKHWNPDTKQIEDLPKKCEYKPMDWCLMKDNGCEWTLCQFIHITHLDNNVYKYVAVGAMIFKQCIPYNDSTKHLLGTTDEWEGGEG